jgi:hypothetical protein
MPVTLEGTAKAAIVDCDEIVGTDGLRPTLECDPCRNVIFLSQERATWICFPTTR